MKIDYAQKFYDFVNKERMDYELLSPYVKTDIKVLMKHKTCGHEWKVTPHIFKSKYSGCPICSVKLVVAKKRIFNSIEFYNYANNRPNYLIIGTYINNSTKVLIKHKTCGYEWYVTPNSFKDKNSNCPKCSGKLPLNTEILKKWILVNRPEYELLSEYINTDSKVLMKHLVCNNTWPVTPHDFKSKYSSCPKCSKSRQYSAIAIEWLTNLSVNLNIDIKHAENGGEYRLPIAGYKVDGFCKATNTVFEFHGTAYHGGYDSTKNKLISAIPDKDPEELFENTIRKMNTIISHGYKLFYVFESDYKVGILGDYY